MVPIYPISLLFLLNVVPAQSTCDASNAITPEQFISAVTDTSVSSESSSGSEGVSCVVYPTCPYCSQDPTAELCRSWKQTQLTNDFNGVVLDGADSFGGYKRSLALECTDSEYCVAALDNYFICVDATSLDFKDSNGGNGNLESDTYTMSNGEVTEVASTATAIPTPTASGSKTTATATTSGAATRTSATSTASPSGTTAASSAANTKAHGLCGMTLLMVGIAAVLL